MEGDQKNVIVFSYFLKCKTFVFPVSGLHESETALMCAFICASVMIRLLYCMIIKLLCHYEPGNFFT